MELQQFAILALIGILAGILGGFMGVGGGIIIVPALIYFFGLSQQEAQGTSLAAIMILPVGALAVFNYYQQGKANLWYAAVIALFFVLGSFLGSKFALKLDPETLKKFFGALLVLMGIKLLIGK